MNRSLLLDSLRILAITLVLIAHIGQLFGHHIGDFFGWKNIYFVSLGGVGVSLFLILSGLLAGLSDSARPLGYLRYLLKKARRLYPAYWLSLPLALLGYLLGESLLSGGLPRLFPNGFLTDLIGSLTGFYAWAGLWGGPYNPPSWFLSLIMSLYLLCPVLIWLIQRWSHYTLLGLFCISLGTRYYVGQWGLPFIEPSLLDQVEGWLYRWYGFMPGRPGDWFPPCRLFEFGLVIYLAHMLPRAAWFSLSLPGSHLIRKLSDLAFPLFLVHYPFLFLIIWLTNLGVPVPVATGLYLIFALMLAQLIDRLDKRLGSLGFRLRSAPDGWIGDTTDNRPSRSSPASESPRY